MLTVILLAFPFWLPLAAEPTGANTTFDMEFVKWLHLERVSV